MPSITLLFFAHLKEISGFARTELNLEPGTTVEALKIRLVETYPGSGKCHANGNRGGKPGICL